MPVLDVEIVDPTGLRLDPGLAPNVAEAAGQIFGTLAGETWIKLRTLSYQFYTEDGDPTADNVWPVFVSVLLVGLTPARLWGSPPTREGASAKGR